MDPVKGPPALLAAYAKLGMAVQELGGRVNWHYQLPKGLRNAIKRRQPVEGTSKEQDDREEGHANSRPP